MNDFSGKEGKCQITFSEIGQCFHLWTKEDFEIIFRNDSDFRIGMGIIAICAKCFPDVRILTYELMTNHLHILAAGKMDRLMAMFEQIRKYLRRMTEDEGRTINWDNFKAGVRLIEELNDARNVLIYDNRNGYLVNDNCSPFSYPWGSNYCYFNPEARKRYLESAVSSTIKERRTISHSHISDRIADLKMLDHCFSPFSFCDINSGENLFRDAKHYFYLLGKNIEQNIKIAREIGEGISYTDDELYAAISLRCKKECGTLNVSQIPAEEKMNIAKILHFEYNASQKQIQRILRLDAGVLISLFGSRT